MYRLIIGLILIGLGSFFAWEAHSVLNMDAFELQVEMSPNAPVTSTELNAIDSPAADLAEKLGADTFNELDDHLSMIRIEGIVMVIVGFILVITRSRRPSIKPKKKRK